MDEEKRQNKIVGATAFLMLAVAVFFDLIQFFLAFIPLIGFIFNKLISIIAAFTFWLWLTLKGVESKRKWILGGVSFFELLPIPFLSALPMFTGGIIAIILKERVKGVTEEII